MICFEEYPIWTVVYNLSAAGGLTALGIVAAAHFGTGLLVVYLVLVAVALAGTLATVCARRAGPKDGRGDPLPHQILEEVSQ